MSVSELRGSLISQLLHSCPYVLICYEAVKASSRLHVGAFKGGGNDQWNLSKIKDRHTPVVEHQQALVIKITKFIRRRILSIKSLPFEHDRSIMGSLQTPVLLHLVEAGSVVITWTFLTKEV